jgi:hypothetical protein
MAVPKASVNEDYFASAREDEVWLAGKIGAVKSKAVTQPMH